MYEIKVDNKNVGYSESVVYIRLHNNGCYVPCNPEDAEGFCVKTAKTRTDEKGEEYTFLSDTVYRLKEKGLRGTEPIASIETIEGAIKIAEHEKSLSIILGEDFAINTLEKARQVKTKIDKEVVSPNSVRKE